MKKALLLTTIVIIAFVGSALAQPNVFNPADPIVIYNSGAAPGSAQNPSTLGTGEIQKWVITNTNLGWNTSSYKAYHIAGTSFRLKFPRTYQHGVADGKKYPVMLFFHGAGEREGIYGNQIQLVHGGQLFRDRVDNTSTNPNVSFDGFLLYPQNQSGGFSGTGIYEKMIRVMDSLAKYCKLDIDRVVVTGLSAGGQACFEFTSGYTTRVTKAMPSAAAVTINIPSYIHVPIWFATGGLDNNPNLGTATLVYNQFKDAGGDIRWSLYPNEGHFVWNTHWNESQFVGYMNDMHKANPLVYYQRYDFCPDSPVNARIGITAGFYEYEWTKDGAFYATGAHLNEITATTFGTYRVRFRRVFGGPWSEYSPKPAVIGPKATTQTPPITVKGLRSKVLPAPDGSTTTPLKLPPGYIGYEWFRVSDNALVDSDSLYTAPIGVYRARVKENFGCNALFSPNFSVVSANGVNKPEAAKNLAVFPVSPTRLLLEWTENPAPAFNETGFEIYRSPNPGGPYTLINITAPNVTSYTSTGLIPNTPYYYIVRAVNDFSAAAVSNEASLTTQADNVAPSIPGNLTLMGATRTEAHLFWSPSTDNVGLDRYDIFVNGVKLYTTDKTVFVVAGLTPFQTYNFTVKARDLAGNVSGASNQVTAFTKMQGLIYYYYEGNWAELPDFNAQTIIKGGLSPIPDVGVRNRNDQFGMLWQGYVRIPTTGNYTFETCSDDGSQLFLNQYYSFSGAPNIDNDGLHGYQCITHTASFTAGSIVPISAPFFEQGGGETMELWWTYPGQARQQIPAAFFTEAGSGGGTIPTAPSALGARATAHDRITLNWTDNSGAVETGFEITRSTSRTGPFTNVITTGPNVTTAIDSLLSPSTVYFYRIRAISGAGESAYSPVTNTEANYRLNNNANDNNGAVLRSLALSNATFTNVAANVREGSHALSFPNNAAPSNGYGTVNNSTGGGFPSDGGYDQRTLALWIKNTSTALKQSLMDIGGPDNGLSIRINAGQIQGGIARGNVRATIGAAYAATNTWTHIALVYNANTLRLYVNGAEVASNSTLGYTNIAAASGSSSRFGYPTTDNAFNDAQNTYTQYVGFMDDIRIINAALTPAEIAAMMNDNYYPATDTTLAPPPAPGVPQALTATALSSSRIDLAFTDNSTNETGFEIYRATVDIDAQYRLLTTIPAAPGSGSQRTYIDDGLFANVRYYYKVRSLGPITPSAYSNKANAMTANTKPVMTNINDFTMKFNTRDTLDLVAVDADGDALTFTTASLPSFATVQSVSNGLSRVIFTPRYNNQGAYVISIYVGDGNGGSDTTYFTMVVNDNTPPILNPVNNVTIKEGGDTTINLSGTDAEGNGYVQWQFTGLPSFVEFTNTGNGTASLRIRPGFAASGVHNVVAIIEDGFGGWAERPFSITVTDMDPNQKILVNYKYTSTAPLPWNNWTYPAQTINNLLTDQGVATTIDAMIVNPAQILTGDLGAQTGNNSGVYPDLVMKDFLFWGFFNGNNLQDTSTLRILGLDLNKTYNFRFFASSVLNNNPQNPVKYKIGAQEVTLNAQNNTTQTVYLNNITPEAGGIINISMIGDPDPNRGGYLNAFEIITNFDDGSVPAKPVNLTGQFELNIGTVLHWDDIAFNELRYKVYRSTSRSGSYTLLNPGATNVNATSYTDATPQPFVEYFYYLIAENAAGVAPSSDTISVIAGNNFPVITSLGNIYVKTDAAANEDFSVSDNIGDVVTVSTTNLPSFATLQNLGSGNYRIAVNATKDHEGLYYVKIAATDDKGAKSEQSMIIHVSEKNTRAFWVNFSTNAAVAGGYPWNEYPGGGPGLIANLRDDAGVVSTYTMGLGGNVNGGFDLGHITGNNSGIISDSSLRSSVMTFGTMNLTFGNLNPAKRYNVVFYPSVNDGISSISSYTVAGQPAVSMDARYNTTRSVQLNRITPVGNSISITVSKDASALVGYLNAVILEEYDNTVVLLNPINLFATPRTKSSVVLTWADRANNETGYDVFRATSAAGPWTTPLFTTAANVTTYTDAAATPNTKYFYQVRARIAPSTFSEFSNMVSTITPQTETYVNFTFTYPSPAPWNNTNANPDLGKVFPNMINDANINTGVTLTITGQFNGQFEAGMQTFGTTGIFPNNVMRSNYWVDKLQVGQWKVSGLNLSKRYRFGFFGSTGPGWSSNTFKDYISAYSIGSRTVYLNAHWNDTKVVYIGDVVPDGNGEVIVNMSTLATSDFGFTAAMIIQAYDDPTGGVVPNSVERDRGNNPVTVVDRVGEPVSNNRNTDVNGITTTRIHAYPNPFLNNLSIDFYNNAAGNKVMVEIYDLNGRLVFSRNAGNVSIGKNTLRLNLENSTFTAGIYTVKLNINGQAISTAKLIKGRQ